MPCCGQKREALKFESTLARATRASAHAVSAFAATPAPAKSAPVALKYVGDGSLSLRGPRSGRIYLFTSGDNATEVEPNDVEDLLRTMVFARA